MKKSLIRLLSFFLVLLFVLPAALAETEQPDSSAEAGNAVPAVKLPIDMSPGMKPDPNGYTGEWAYSDPTISVEIEEGAVPTLDGKCSYWVATIKIADASQLRTMAASDFNGNRVAKGTVLANRVNAVLAINGDYYCYTGKGYILRQGETYLDILKGERDVLLIDEDGDFHAAYMAQPGSLDGTVNGKKVINAFYFGPVLVENGEALKMPYLHDMASDTGRQRMALCQVGPLEYKAICCAGPARGSTGLTLQEFADFCASQGAQIAYNLDGGDSTMMIIRGKKINDVYNQSVREIADIIYFASAWGAEQK